MGDIRQDGKIFWGTHHGGKPRFVTPEKFKELTEKNRARAREWGRKNPERNAARLKAWKEANPEKWRLARIARERKPSAIERKKQYNKNRYLNDPAFRQKQMDWAKNNPEKRRAVVRKWSAKAYRKNPLMRLRINLSSRIRKKLLILNSIKNAKTVDFIGCSITDFKLHIEKQFEVGMTWENYAWDTWHLDHITPCAKASTAEELRQLFHFTNFRPMWGPDNMKKSDWLPDGTRARYQREAAQPTPAGVPPVI